MKKRNMLMTSAMILSMIFCLAFDCKSSKTGAAGADAPSEEVVKQLLTEKFTSNQYATRKETLEFESIDFYQPNQGVYPARIKCTRVVRDSDGRVKRFAMDGLFHFLRSQANEWTFNVQEWYRNEEI